MVDVLRTGTVPFVPSHQPLLLFAFSKYSRIYRIDVSYWQVKITTSCPLALIS